jgi:hypothetical protein
MPRYFFHIEGEGLRREDREGRQLPGFNQVRAEARRIANEILADAGESGVGSNAHINVTDETGATVLALRFFDALADHE